MTKTHTIETIEEYDNFGRLIKKTITETTETDDCPISYTHTFTPYSDNTNDTH